MNLFWPSWVPLGALLEASWSVLGPLERGLGSFLGASWGVLAAKRPYDHPKDEKNIFPLGPGGSLRDSILEGFSVPFVLTFHHFLIIA